MPNRDHKLSLLSDLQDSAFHGKVKDLELLLPLITKPKTRTFAAALIGQYKSSGHLSALQRVWVRLMLDRALFPLDTTGIKDPISGMLSCAGCGGVVDDGGKGICKACLHKYQHDS